jgi:hypothetical protein
MAEYLIGGIARARRLVSQDVHEDDSSECGGIFDDGIIPSRK